MSNGLLSKVNSKSSKCFWILQVITVMGVSASIIYLSFGLNFKYSYEWNNVSYHSTTLIWKTHSLRNASLNNSSPSVWKSHAGQNSSNLSTSVLRSHSRQNSSSRSTSVPKSNTGQSTSKLKNDVIKKALPQVEIMVTGPSWKKPPLLDAVRYGLTCKACDSKFNLVNINWSGVRYQKSVWITELQVKRVGFCIERDLDFRPYLEYHAGDYTCHLTIKDNDGSTFVVNKTVNIKNEYHGLKITRMVSTKFDNSPVVSSKWFPNANLCGGSDRIWQEYANFHAAVLSGKQKGGYLIFDCTQRVCAGYGNRMQAITSLLILAMLTDRVFLIDSPNPVNLNHYLLPNAIQWNHTAPKGMISRLFGVPGKTTIQQFENELFHSDKQSVIRVRTYFGLSYFHQLMSENFADLLLTTFNLKTFYDSVLLYGCAFDYLFKYQPRIHEIIESMQKEYNLETGKFVALHVRSRFHEEKKNVVKVFNPLNLDFPFKPMFECVAMAAKALSHKLNVAKVPIFLVTDHQRVTDYAKQNYPGMMIFSHAPYFHIDKTKYTGSHARQQYDDGMVGILSDIEISSRAAVLVRSADSSFSEEIGALHYMMPKYNLHPFYFYDNLTYCQL